MQKSVVVNEVMRVFSLIANSHADMKWAEEAKEQFVPSSQFRCCEIMTKRMNDNRDELQGYDVYFVNPFDKELKPDVVPVMDFSYVKEGAEKEVLLEYANVKSIPLKHLRGVIAPLGVYNYEVKVSLRMTNGLYKSVRTLASWNGTEHKVLQYRDGRPYWASDEHVDNTIKAVRSMALTRRYTWGVEFKRSGVASVFVPCNAAAAKRLFSDRDKREGDDRRKALEHWVNDHYRAKPNREEEVVQILGYLRGVDTFMWNDFECKIHPAAYDLDKYGENYPNKRRA